jgi:hypothetical protein
MTSYKMVVPPSLVQAPVGAGDGLQASTKHQPRAQVSRNAGGVHGEHGTTGGTDLFSSNDRDMDGP